MTTQVAPEVAGAVEEAAGTLRRHLAGRDPSVAIVLGSGLGAFAERLSHPLRIRYAEIPHFHPSTVIGHAGELVVGKVKGKTVLVQSGRFHMYEGHSAQAAAIAVRAFAELGIKTMILTNAAGGIRRTFATGAVMLIADHINLTFRNPLIGSLFPGEGRFPDMSDPYDSKLRTLAREVARRERILLAEGVYCQLLGPSYETPAEIRMLERLGADAVGMSTVVEVIAARARGMRCLGFSAVTNAACGILPVKLNHLEVMEVAARVSGDLTKLIEGVVAEL